VLQSGPNFSGCPDDTAVRCLISPELGRYLIYHPPNTVSTIEAPVVASPGTLLMSSQRYAAVPTDTAASRVCHHCLRPLTSASRSANGSATSPVATAKKKISRCAECLAALFCDRDCMAAGAVAHDSVCGALGQLRRMAEEQGVVGWGQRQAAGSFLSVDNQVQAVPPAGIGGGRSSSSSAAMVDLENIRLVLAVCSRWRCERALAHLSRSPTAGQNSGGGGGGGEGGGGGRGSNGGGSGGDGSGSGKQGKSSSSAAAAADAAVAHAAWMGAPMGVKFNPMTCPSISDVLQLQVRRESRMGGDGRHCLFC
jgi:hypothetical protein